MMCSRTSWSNIIVVLALLATLMPLAAVPATAQEPNNQSLGEAGPHQIPIFFEANRGQFDERVQYVARHAGSQGRGASFWFTAEEVRVVLSRLQADPWPQASANRPALGGEAAPPALEQMALTVRFRGSSQVSHVEGQDLLPGRLNYFLGNNPARWQQNVPAFSSILYRNLYPQTDLRYYGSGGHLKYDFILRPGARVEEITLDYDGVEGLLVNDAGQLEIRTAWGTLVEEAPLAWQETASDGREPVAVAYKLSPGNRLGYRLGAYDRSRTLVLDPTLNYSTYLGGEGQDLAHYTVVDDKGNAFVTGSTKSDDFPTSDKAFAQLNSGSWDAFVTKLSADGSSLLFSTYVGGDGIEVGYGLALDDSGNIVVAGATDSPDFPTTSGAFDQTFNGGKYDAFVLKLAGDGGSLIYSTYVGGADEDIAYTLALDEDEPVIAGVTHSAGFPTSSNAFDRFHNGLGDVFVTKLADDGESLRFSTLAGGKGEDLGRRLALTHGGDVVVTGSTASEDFPTTSGSYAPAYFGDLDVFVLELDASGRSLNYSTYVGGKSEDKGNGLALSRGGDPVVTGSTRSGNFPTTPGAYNPTDNGGEDAFVLKLKNSGRSLEWSTYLGGSDTDAGMVVELDALDNPIVAGFTRSTNLPTSDDSLDSDYNGEGDAFLAKLAASGDALEYGTYAGGTAQDEARGLALTGQGDAVVAGWTESEDFPTTKDAFDPTYNYRQDGFVLRLDRVGALPPLTLDSTVSQSSDDAIERSSDGSVDLESPELKLLGDPGTHTAGLRFQDISVPQGAQVLGAYVEFTAADTDTKPTHLSFHGQAADHAPTFTSDANDISARVVTTASVKWQDIPPWNNFHATYRSPDVSIIVQEVVDRPGWNSGNALVLIITGEGKREAVSYDGDPELAPKLYVEYLGDPAACYGLATTSEPAEGGTVSAEPAPNCEGVKYVTGTQVTLTAQPATNYLFQSWSGNATGTANPTTITMDGDKAVTARFRKDGQGYLLYLPVALREAP